MKTTDVRVLRAITATAAGQPVVVNDDSGGDGYLVCAGDAATPALLAFMIRHTSGYVRAALPGSECERLNLPPMCHRNPQLCVSVDVRGTGTGISASDRARTIAALASGASQASDFLRPGHVVPVQASRDGVLDRPGAAEAAVDLASLAGRRRAAALCEIVSRRNPAQLAHGVELTEFAVEHGLAVVSIAELVAYRRRTEPQVVRLTETVLPTWAGASCVIGFRDVHNGGEHLAMIIGSADAGVPVPLHVHVECLTGDVFGSKACACGGELNSALTRMSAQGSGVVVYLRPSGRPRACGLFARRDAAGDPMPETVAWILRDLGLYALKLSDDMPGFGLVMFGAIREHGIGTETLAVAG
ncbi:3,4-dihydroxy-2-butanone-4-phosphate synthase [Mycobacterium montefiorense]|uniref:3,4-dihydroxy-2-butanone-4-phosphate synthase n=1 Tax=Mycobacterium montefiorense TaxID=154654 RepID=A0AA37UPF0_9MYCO|nr:3,4-dihydroxy-2-butanone-4-phosphate synthase [Mycobacterium montefiorense]GBG39052.1 riboflavin biosynthesis protein RibA [Mycobacterium montefiorense]GKU32840.1 riboflavin biosynthesis protein RibA [Mycobacterium montefiorense]GKU38361.1 riboflavin biosynthesis protein RibA [Mycobacterium montefiorense]GKU47275.1 riboflavin biosynthesis protein RibA [Mycobacterium montefiorense]GKU50391.1 riboflavin biosynthesis protein RibA [Mycobacterium montefiorense]